MKKLSLIALTTALLFLSGCITIFEKYTIHSDGSGTMEYIIDMSEMLDMMSAFSDSSQEMESPGIDETMRAALPGLEEIQGITNVELTGDNARYIAGVKFDFTDAKALNKAMAVLLTTDGSNSTDVKYVDIKGKNFTRYSRTSEEFNKETLLGSEELDAETMNMVLESMKYNITVNFDKPVKKVTSKANVTKDEKSVTLETNFSEIFDKEDYLQMIIKTK